jgi:hypothetical protein
VPALLPMNIENTACGHIDAIDQETHLFELQRPRREAENASGTLEEYTWTSRDVEAT